MPPGIFYLKIDENNPFQKACPLELKETGKEEYSYEPRGIPTLPQGKTMTVKWQPQKAYHNFIDFNTVGRPPVRYIALQSGVLGYAITYEECQDDKSVTVYLGFDDEIVVRLNDKIAYKGHHLLDDSLLTNV